MSLLTATNTRDLPLYFENLTNWYPFDPDTYGGSRTDDVTANVGGSGDDTAYDITDVTNVTYQTDVGPSKFGSNAYLFDPNGGTGRLRLDSSFGFGSTAERTVNVWATFSNDNSDYASLYGDYSGVNDNIWRYQENGGDMVLYANYDDGDGSQTVAGFSRQVYGWKMWTVVYTGNEVRFYFDGVKQDTHTGVGFKTGGHEFALGARDGRNDKESWGGYITDFRIYNRALSDSEVSDIYSNTE